MLDACFVLFCFFFVLKSCMLVPLEPVIPKSKRKVATTRGSMHALSLPFCSNFFSHSPL